MSALSNLPSGGVTIKGSDLLKQAMARKGEWVLTPRAQQRLKESLGIVEDKSQFTNDIYYS